MIQHRPRWIAQALLTDANRTGNPRRIEVDRIDQKVVRVDRFNPERLEAGLRKVFEVERHDGLRLAVNRGGKHMAIVWVGQAQG